MKEQELKKDHLLPGKMVSTDHYRKVKSDQSEMFSGGLLGGRHKEGRSRGTVHDTTSLKHRKGEGRIAADVVLNIRI